MQSAMEPRLALERDLMPDIAERYEQLLSIPRARKRWVKADTWLGVIVLLLFLKVWQTIKALRDPSRGEVFNDFLPVLILGNRNLFVVSYRHRTDRHAQVPIATLLLDEQGQVLADDPLFEQAYTNFNFSLNPTIPV